ncbi:glutamate 5-kinase [Candidatus Aerophobetes bacterium]|nr:glutamate 5-kinase [Candidatus Aerophobetes bacterium]
MSIIPHINRVTIKIGSSLLLEENILNISFIEKLTKDIATLFKKGKEIVLVSSGAIGMGKRKLGVRNKLSSIPSKQALAAIGQTDLMNLYYRFFQKYGLSVGQVLLTRADLSSRSSYLNARNTILTLLKLKVIPIINENDTVAVEEIKFGDNDTLSALVAGLIDAELLIIFSDIEGLYTADPKKNPEAELIKQVKKIDKEVEKIAKSSSIKGRVGGMQTKIEAAKIATRSGIPVIIGGKRKNFLLDIFYGERVGTLFLPQTTYLSSRKRWIAYGHRPQGEIIVDKGAKEALIKKGKSLLPVGIKEIRGHFEIGDSVSLLDEEKKEFARGIVYYSSKELKKIKGEKSSLIESLLGYKYYDEIIHRDNLVIL